MPTDPNIAYTEPILEPPKGPLHGGTFPVANSLSRDESDGTLRLLLAAIHRLFLAPVLVNDRNTSRCSPMCCNLVRVEAAFDEIVTVVHPLFRKSSQGNGGLTIVQRGIHILVVHVPWAATEVMGIIHLNTPRIFENLQSSPLTLFFNPWSCWEAWIRSPLRAPLVLQEWSPASS